MREILLISAPLGDRELGDREAKDVAQEFEDKIERYRDHLGGRSETQNGTFCQHQVYSCLKTIPISMSPLSKHNSAIRPRDNSSNTRAMSEVVQ